MLKCNKFHKLISLHIYNELTQAEQSALEAHLRGCRKCQSELERLKQFGKMLNAGVSLEPTEAFLIHNRNLLENRLKNTRSVPSQRKWIPQFIDLSSYRKSTVLRLAMSFALLLIGFFVGRLTFSNNQKINIDKMFLEKSCGPGIHSLAGTEISDPKIVNFQLVRQNPNANQVEIRFNILNRVALRGTVNDAPIRELLTYSAMHTEHPGIRLQSVKALGSRYSEDAAVQKALIHVMEHDENAGVRLRAIKILKHMPMNKELKNILIKIILKDINPGIRMEAIDALSKWPDAEIKPAFLNAARTDENKYIRLKASKILERRDKPALKEIKIQRR